LAAAICLSRRGLVVPVRAFEEQKPGEKRRDAAAAMLNEQWNESFFSVSSLTSLISLFKICLRVSDNQPPKYGSLGCSHRSC
jgi:hypothetical protein